MADAKPEWKGYLAIAHLIFLITCPLLMMTTKVGFAVQIFGLIQKHGLPKFSMAYVQQIMTDDHFQNMGYMLILIFGQGNLITIAPLAIWSFIKMSECVNVDSNPNT